MLGVEFRTHVSVWDGTFWGNISQFYLLFIVTRCYMLRVTCYVLSGLRNLTLIYIHITIQLSLLLLFFSKYIRLTLFRMGIVGAAHGWGGGEKMPSLPKIYHRYPAMMKLGTVIPYQKKIQKIYESRDAPPAFCPHQHFLPEIRKFSYIKKYIYSLHFDT